MKETLEIIMFITLDALLIIVCIALILLIVGLAISVIKESEWWQRRHNKE